MLTLFKTLFSISLIYLMFSVLACQEDSTCSTKAFYRGTLVCFGGEDAAAVQLEFNDKYIILDNFFDFIEEGTLEYDDVVYVEYDDVDFGDASPASCGGQIVAPVTNLTCITVE